MCTHSIQASSDAAIVDMRAELELTFLTIFKWSTQENRTSEFSVELIIVKPHIVLSIL